MHPFKLLVNKVLRRSLMKSVLEILLSALNKNLDFTMSKSHLLYKP